MSRAKPDSLLALTQSFFLSYLQSTRGASPHTIRAYRDALKLFFQHLASQKRKSIADLGLDDIQAEAVLTFLDHIESKRNNAAGTRNCRLAAIRTSLNISSGTTSRMLLSTAASWRLETSGQSIEPSPTWNQRRPEP